MNELVRQQWLIPALPLAAAAVQSLLNRRQRRLSATLSIGAMTMSCALALRALAGTVGHHETCRAVWNFTWFEYGTTRLQLGFILNPLTAGMAAMVTFVGLMIFIFATGYMAEDDNFTRFFCFMSLFAAAMLGLVVSNNLLLLYICWELVGLCSYLLIGFWFHKPSAAAAMKKAFITTRIGDIGFFVGLLMLYWHAGTLNLYDAGKGALEQADRLATLAGWFGLTMAGTIAILLFFGAMGKSAQFPLHVWLPDAMEGPTPVSALIHAATMVAAGVFMVGRMFPMFAAGAVDGTTPALQFVMWTGCVTALFSATIAVAQNDIKRVLAYSTCSQLGFMMMALGAGGLVAGQFHLLTHAFFKALLFLGAGSIIIGTHHEQDMTKMGGLRKLMPVTFATYVAGMLALSGFPFTAGFFSKDEVLLVTYHRDKLAWALATFAAFLTAFYMTRQVCLVFFGNWRGHHKPHETPWNMTGPLVLLAVFAVFMGWLAGGFHHFVAPEEPKPEHSNLVLWLSIGVGLAGIALGWLVYGRKPLAHAAAPDPLAGKLGPVFTLLKNKWYVDEFYDATIVRLTVVLAAFFRWVDKRVVDGALHATVWLARAISHAVRWVGDEFLINGGFDAGCQSVRGSGSALSKLQDGRVQSYFRVLGLGVAILLVIYLVR
jgi:NADH-quinone oxidoreductase subunit L